MAHPPQQAAGGRWDFDPLTFVIRTWATAVEVFTRRDLGSRYFGIEAAAVLPLLMFYACLWEGHDIVPLFTFVPCYMAACVLHRVAYFRRRRKWEPGHSRYNGTPRCLLCFPKRSELTVKKWIEPGLIAAFGYLVTSLNAPCGWFLIVGAGCMSLTAVVADAAIYFRALDIYDSTQEQTLVAERFRELRGDRF